MKYTFEPLRGTYYNTLGGAALALVRCMAYPNPASVELTGDDISQSGVKIRIENGTGWVVYYTTKAGSLVRYLCETEGD